MLIMCWKKAPEPKYRLRKLILHEERQFKWQKKNLVSMEEAQQNMENTNKQKRKHQPKINHDIIIKSHSVQGSFVLIVIDEDVQCL